VLIARGAIVGALVLMGIFTRPILAAEDPDTASVGREAELDATIVVSGWNAAIGVGLSSGSGTLTYRGKEYELKVSGMELGGVGISSGTVSGNVYDLKNVEDINGQYSGLGAGGVAGTGGGVLGMRNDKHVIIRVTTQAKGARLKMGASGITLQLVQAHSAGSATGASAGSTPGLPQTLGFGQARFGNLGLRPTFNAQIDGFVEANPGFGGKKVGALSRSELFFETSNEIGLDYDYSLGRFGTLSGRVSGVYSLTGGGLDALATNYPGSPVRDSYTLEAAYLDWTSGDTIPFLGHDGLELSYGRNRYQVGDGFLFWDGASDGGRRGATWLSPRKAFDQMGLARVLLGNWKLEGFFLSPNDAPDTNTNLAGTNLEYSHPDYGVTGFIYAHFLSSDTPTRDGMNLFYWRADTTPFPAVKDAHFLTSVAAETNDASSGLTNAFGWYVGPAYTFSRLPWKPTLFGRYASFSGGTNHAFDPLFLGLPDWGSWFQGEVLGEWLLSNSNLVSYQARVKAVPNDSITLNLIYYSFQLQDPSTQALGSGSTRAKKIADEVDFIVDLTLTNWWTVSATYGLAVPGPAAKDATGGSAVWSQGMLYMNWTF
jgi:alginate export protein